MADIALIVPGIMGSDIYKHRGTVYTQYWPSPVSVARYGLRPLQRGVGGIGEESDFFGIGAVSRAPIPFYYSLLDAALRLGPWADVRYWPYDWRLPVLQLADQLAAAIIADGNTHFIVGHSMGGLVALVAANKLRLQMRQGLVGGLVTVGSPLWGSYGAVRALARVGWPFDAISSTLQFVRTRVGVHLAQSALVDRPMCSWPSMYDLMPSPSQPLVNDPLRDHLFFAETWRDAQPDIDVGLLAIPAVLDQYLLGIPLPTYPLCVVQGYGVPTPNGWNGNPIADSKSYIWGEGDGTVSIDSGRIATLPHKDIPGEHGALPRHPTLLVHINAWLRQPAPSEEFSGAVIR